MAKSLKFIVVFFILTIMLAACSNNEVSYDDTFRIPANNLIDFFTIYTNNNPDYFSVASYWYTVDDYYNNDYCAYDVLFHELIRFDIPLDEECLQARIILKALSPLGSGSMVNLSEFSKNSYKTESYSSLVLYHFDEPEYASTFAHEFVDFTEKLYKENYILVGAHDNPWIFFEDNSHINYDFAHYLVATPNFIDYNDDTKRVHMIILVVDSKVLVHKTYTNLHRILIKA